nr:hypothetical protein [Tanacetum cinerariifolium]
QPGMNMGQDKQMQMVGGNGENQFRQYAGQNVGNLNGYNAVQNVRNQVAQNPRVQNVGNQNGLIGVLENANLNGNLVAARAEGNTVGHNGNQIRCYNYRGVGYFARNCMVKQRRRDAAYLQTQLLIAQKEEVGIQLQAEEFDLIAAATDLDEIEEVNANCNLMANLQQALTSGTQTDKALVYDSDRSAEVHDYENCYDNETFNMCTQEEQCIEILKPIPEPHQKMALGYQNPFYLKQTQKKQQSLYDGKVLLEKHDHLVVHDSEETLQLAQESRGKMKQLNKKIKPANYTKINHLLDVFVSQTAKSRKELYFSNDSKTTNVSKSISIPNEEFSDDTTPSVAPKFVGDFKSLTKEADDSLAKHKALELEIKRLLKAVVSQDIMSVMQIESVVDTSYLQTKLERTKERFENYIIKKENEYAKLWNDWINPVKTSREEKHVPITVRASARTKPITISQPPVITKKDVNSDSNGLSSTGIDNTKTRRPQPR